jgi:hypothetical protein
MHRMRQAIYSGEVEEVGFGRRGGSRGYQRAHSLFF